MLTAASCNGGLMLLVSFLVFLCIFLAIGLWSAKHSQGTTDDYLMAGQSVPPWLVGLSAIATNNSGFMFVGMIGVTYQTGLSSIWLMIGWIAGDLCANLYTVSSVRRISKNPSIQSFGGLLAQWHDQRWPKAQAIIGLITVLFLTVYAAAQLKAGSKAATVMLDWHPDVGIVVSAFLVLLYSMAGGLRASIWTDAAQSVVMFGGMLLLCVAGLQAAGGASEAVSQLSAVNPQYWQWFPETSNLGKVLFVVGWFFGGFAVMGQPQIVIRFMTLNHDRNVNRMRMWYYIWFVVFYALTVGVGLLSRLLIPETDNFDAETALPVMASQIFPAILVGLVLAAMFAAAMSTADSLILACSAAITRDFSLGKRVSLRSTKLVTLAVLTVAAGIGVSDQQTVFALVLDAWGMLACTFLPLLLVQSRGRHLLEWQAIVVMAGGLGSFLAWSYGGGEALVYSVAPGIVFGTLLAFALSSRKAPVTQP